MPKNLIEIWDPEEPECGEFHVSFTLEKTPSGYERVKCKEWGGKCEGNTLSADTLKAINIAYLGALRDAENEMKPSRNSKLAMLLETLASTPEEKDSLVSKLRNANQEILETEEFPVKVFFEKKIQSEYTKASVHGVKGETYDALLLLIESTRGTTLTPSFLASGDTSKELMRIAYVAMTRPRKLLVVAMPKSRADLSKRFPRDKWDYVDLT